MAISDILLGKRSLECTAGFADVLRSHGCPIDDFEKAKYFWSPSLSANSSDADREVGVHRSRALSHV
jgi:hypothetical protein